MPEQLQFELASPEKMLVSKAIVMAAVPSPKGLYGVLAGHAPMITTVAPGVVEVYENDDVTVTDRIFVEGGFAEVTGERCTVLAEKAVPVSQLNRAAIEAEMQAIENETARAESDEELDALEIRRIVATAKLMAVE
ncbi:MAG: ATP synthase F1 subunit epsilon [Alphaproteobacteria bacterium]|nr:ATP synthase F1 subunit epsilon [Alphaproteobacteria bacterium]